MFCFFTTFKLHLETHHCKSERHILCMFICCNISFYSFMVWSCLHLTLHHFKGIWKIVFIFNYYNYYFFNYSNVLIFTIVWYRCKANLEIARTRFACKKFFVRRSPSNMWTAELSIEWVCGLIVSAVVYRVLLLNLICHQTSKYSAFYTFFIFAFNFISFHCFGVRERALASLQFCRFSILLLPLASLQFCHYNDLILAPDEITSDCKQSP